MNTITRCKPLLGTFVEILISGDCGREVLLEYSECAYGIIQDIHNKMSFHSKESELSKINKCAFKGPVKISKELSDVLRTGAKYSELSNGLFDMTVGYQLVRKGKLPDHGIACSTEATWQDIEIEDDQVFFRRPLMVDLGGIAKGYAVDLGFERIAREKSQKKRISKIVVNAGGDLRSWPWKGSEVAIRVPKEPFTDTINVKMSNSAVATSGPYFGGSIVANKEIITNAPSVSVFCENCIDADALTKIYSIKPEQDISGIDHARLNIDENGLTSWSVL